MLRNSYFFPPGAIKLVYLLKDFKLYCFLEIKYSSHFRMNCASNGFLPIFFVWITKVIR